MKDAIKFCGNPVFLVAKIKVHEKFNDAFNFLLDLLIF